MIDEWVLNKLLLSAMTPKWWDHLKLIFNI